MTKLQPATKDFSGISQSETVTGSLTQKRSNYSHSTITGKNSYRYGRNQPLTKNYAVKAAETSS